MTTRPQLPRPPMDPKDPPPTRTSSTRIARLERDLATAPDASAARDIEDAFWTDVEAIGTPLIEHAHAGQCIATFLWRAAPADQVADVVLLANKLTDPSVADLARLRLVAGSVGTWTASFLLPSDWRGTYRIAPSPEPFDVATATGRTRWGTFTDHAQPDPFARASFRTVGAGSSGTPKLQSLAELPYAPPQPWRSLATPDGEQPAAWQLVPASSRNTERRVWLHEAAPATDTSTPRALVVVLDGDSWRPGAPLARLADHLVAAGECAPMLLVAPDAISLAHRWRELGSDEPDFARWLDGPLVTWARDAIPSGAPIDIDRAVIIGQSLGALTALRAVARPISPYRRAIAQSASLWYEDAEATITDRLRAHAGDEPLELQLQHGSDEWVMTAPNRRLCDALQARAPHVTLDLHIHAGGHDMPCWMDGIARGLRRLLPAR